MFNSRPSFLRRFSERGGEVQTVPPP